MIRFQTKKAQIALEYAMVIACMVAALLLMQHYIKRAISGRLHEAADSIGDQYDPSHIVNSANTPTYTLSQIGTTRTEGRQEEVNSPAAGGGKVFGMRTNTTTNETINRYTDETLGAFPGGLFD